MNEQRKKRKYTASVSNKNKLASLSFLSALQSRHNVRKNIFCPEHSKNILMHPREKVYLPNIYMRKLCSKSVDKRGMQMTRKTERERSSLCFWTMLLAFCFPFSFIRKKEREREREKKEKQPQGHLKCMFILLGILH